MESVRFCLNEDHKRPNLGGQACTARALSCAPSCSEYQFFSFSEYTSYFVPPRHRPLPPSAPPPFLLQERVSLCNLRWLSVKGSCPATASQLDP